jgi:hypothetical protein
VSSPLNVPTVDFPAIDASHTEATSVCHSDRRGTESSKPCSRLTDASDGRPIDAVLHLSQRKVARLLSAKLTDADVSICRVNARASVAPLHIVSCRVARVRRQTLHSRVCRVRRARLSRVSQHKLVPRLRHFFQPSAYRKLIISIPRKRLNPASQVRCEGKRTQNPSQLLKLHRLRKCANTNKCSPPCARVLAFSQSFSRRS